MAKILGNTKIEVNIDKYDAYKALCQDVGLNMLINGKERDYTVENGVLYHTYDASYHGSVNEKKEVYSNDLRKVLLYENLLAIKSFL